MGGAQEEGRGRKPSGVTSSTSSLTRWDPAAPPPLSFFLLPTSPTPAHQAFVLRTLKTPALSACRVGIGVGPPLREGEEEARQGEAG